MKQKLLLLEDKLNSIEKDIYKTQLFLLENGELEEEIYDVLENGHLRAEQAIIAAMNNFSEMFKNIPDEALKSRFKDIEGVCRTIFYNIEPVNEENDLDIILVGDCISPCLLIQNYDHIVGCVSKNVSLESHACIICKSKNIPYISGIDVKKSWNNKTGFIDIDEKTFTVEGETYKGNLVSPNIPFNENDIIEKDIEIKTKIKLNLDSSVSDLDPNILKKISGVGLVRSEFIYMKYNDFPNINEEKKEYINISNSFKDLPVNIRLIDLSEDKKLPYIKSSNLINKNYRSIRFLFENIEILENQLEAIITSNSNGNLSLLIPFVISCEEIRKIKALVEKIKNKRNIHGEVCNKILIGAMIETPAAVMMIDDILDEVDYISIGSNDLLYSMYVADRMDLNSDKYIDSDCKALLKAISFVCSKAHKKRKKVCVCGDIACKKFFINKLIKLGVDELSVPPSKVFRVEKWILEAEDSLTEGDL